ncbi:MAG TPA: cytochrome c [Rhizomicrobium sp.]|jgi:mono/diheme cytochrome c family protein
MSGIRSWFLRQGALTRGALVGFAALIVVGLGLLIWYATTPKAMDFAGGQTMALTDYRGADPSVPAALKSGSTVKRGEYLARAADCKVCHTKPGGRPYAGGLAFRLPFGTIYSPNITSDRETGIGTYTDAQFLAAVHQGIRRDGAHLYPAMPFASYTYMSDADALAIKAYLFSLAPVHAAVKVSTLVFPFNQRWLIGIWSGLFNADQRFRPHPDRSPQWNRGAYLAEALAHCGECHTPRNLAFALNNRRKFAGAVTAGWRGYNITEDKNTGVGAWSDGDLFAYMSSGHATGHGTASGPMGEAVDASFATMAPEDIRAIVVYLRSIPAQSSPDLPAALAPPASPSHRIGPQVANALGKQIYEGACASCHSWTGASPLSSLATLTGARAVNDPGATNVAQIIVSGMKRTTPRGAIAMPAFGNAYSDAEIAAVANYVTARFGSKPSALSGKDVATLRKQTSHAE